MEFILAFLFNEPLDGSSIVRRLAQTSSDIRAETASVLAVGDEMQLMLNHAEDGTPIFNTLNSNAPDFYTLISTYFSLNSAPDAGITITYNYRDDQMRIIAISNNPNDEAMEDELWTVLHAQDILSTREVFISAWPNIVDIDHSGEDFYSEPNVVAVPSNTTFLVEQLLGSMDDEYEELIIIATGATPIEVLKQVMTVTHYYEEDPEYVVSSLDSIEQSIVAVSFDTDRGAVVELRIPLQQKDFQTALALIASQNSRTLNVPLYYVTEVSDNQEVFTIQALSRDGSLGAPETLHLQFN